MILLSRLPGWDKQIFEAIAKSRGGRADRPLRALSNSANNSLLWWAIAGLLAVFGGRRGKRAAGRGVGSIALTSFTVTLGIKNVVKRPRPSIRNVPAVRRLQVAPLTTSFPSGHAASAAAFATSVMIEWPRAGVVIAPVAGAVAYSRVRVGVHYPGDVLAGAMIGAGVASATLLQFPAAPPGRRDPPAYGLHRIEIDPGGSGLHAFANPGSGSPFSFDHSGPVEIGLPEARLFGPLEGEDLEDSLKRAATGCRILAASGGDGTISAAALMAAERGVPLMVLPGGTLNHLARDLRIESVAGSIDCFKRGEAIAVDLARFGEFSFINTATFGAYPGMIRKREQIANRVGRWPAHVASVLWTLLTAKPLEVRINGKSRTIWMAFVGNCAHEPAGFAPAWRPRLDDGKLDLRILSGDKPFSRLRLIASILTGRLTRSSAYERHLVSSVEVDSGEDSLEVTRDGDHVEAPGKFTIDKRRGALTVFAPHE